LTGFFLVLAACAFWALDSLVRYPLVNGGVDAFAIVFYEHLILSVIFLVVFFKSLPKIWDSKLSHLFYFFMIGGVGSALATLAFTRAFYFLNPSLVILLQKFQPVIAISLARIVLKEKVQRVFILWALVCLAGALLISYEDILNLYTSEKNISELLLHPGALQGYILVFISVFGWGAATVFGKKLFLVGYQDEQIMAGRFILGFVCLIPFYTMNKTLFTHSVDVYGQISLMVLVSGLLAMYLYYHGLRKISARACSLTEMFFPFMAVIVNWLFLGTTLTLIQLIGGGLLLIGSIVIQFKRY
jgi:drug/metabolite transporter (DMT)-like permease